MPINPDFINIHITVLLESLLPLDYCRQFRSGQERDYISIKEKREGFAVTYVIGGEHRARMNTHYYWALTNHWKYISLNWRSPMSVALE